MGLAVFWMWHYKNVQQPRWSAKNMIAQRLLTFFGGSATKLTVGKVHRPPACAAAGQKSPISLRLSWSHISRVMLFRKRSNAQIQLLESVVIGQLSVLRLERDFEEVKMRTEWLQIY